LKKPWNLSNVTIYSLASYDTEQEPNMNICTYVTPISMTPKLYSIAIYRNTKTLENCLHSQKAVLQILSKEQIQFVTTFGKKSGLNYNKKKVFGQKASIDLLGKSRGIKRMCRVRTFGKSRGDRYRRK
jgi:flavin reductase (DIM6/NTAB) family NADH-FMN oxidoreductase RutF